jgi:tetratricopeptide (TPR) repeat protein
MGQSRIDQLFAFLKKAPEDAFTLYSIAYEYLQMEDNERALEYFQKLKDRHPDYIGTYYHMGEVLIRLSRREEAMAVYEAGIAMGQKQKDSHAVAELQNALMNAQVWDDDE